MRSGIITLAVCCSVVCGTTAAAEPKPNDSLDGVWEIVCTLSHNGPPTIPSRRDQFRIQGSKLTWVHDAGWPEGGIPVSGAELPLVFDRDSRPYRMALLTESYSPPERPHDLIPLFRCIYDRDGDRLRIKMVSNYADFEPIDYYLYYWDTYPIDFGRPLREFEATWFLERTNDVLPIVRPNAPAEAAALPDPTAK